MRYIFGPVPSRRLGSSLGIDVVPHKICNLDCIYCEVGKTTKLTIKKDSYINIDIMLEELKYQYEKFHEHLDVVTITGAGEPTLNKDLKKIIFEVKKIVHHPLALLTNSTNIDDEKVRDALMDVDILVPSIDAITVDTFNIINRPHKKLNWPKILEELRNFSYIYRGELFIEILFVKGINDSEEELTKLAHYILQLKYDKVQLNTVFRPPAYPQTLGLDYNELINIAIFFRRKGIKVEATGNFVKELPYKNDTDIKTTIRSLLLMRPCTIEDLRLLFGLEKNELFSILSNIENLQESQYTGETYYSLRKI
ncbi:MAG: radical SAM protein [Calditerrivibrio sp.]|nr:radical SAM protein [Calditerrivibrio sp.]